MGRKEENYRFQYIGSQIIKILMRKLTIIHCHPARNLKRLVIFYATKEVNFMNEEIFQAA